MLGYLGLIFGKLGATPIAGSVEVPPAPVGGGPIGLLLVLTKAA
jgi:hypothetical protein